MEEFDFSDIKYHEEEEVSIAIRRVMDEPTFARICKFVEPDLTLEEVTKKILAFDNVKDFQVNFILKVIKLIVSKSVTKLTSSGTGNLSNSSNDKYMFISNHRNIVLDASLINHELQKDFGEDFESTANAIGNNLLSTPWIMDMARLNKSFVVIRDSSVQEILKNSKKLSTYMRNLIMDSKSSVWIAQREGRAKDGNDFTQPGLLKMIQMSGGKDFVQNYGELHIIPVAISYENDPCICNKVKELASIELTGKYDKAPTDDYNSMYDGLMGQKGRVHISFGKEITPEILKTLDGEMPRNEKIKNLAEYIDNFVHHNYKLWPKNYVAADIINGNEQFSSHYDNSDKEHFLNLITEKIKGIDADNNLKERIFLKMWATPVKNAFKNNPDYEFNF